MLVKGQKKTVAAAVYGPIEKKYFRLLNLIAIC